MSNWNEIAEARRKLGTEEGTIVKDWGGRVPVALIYPHSYFVGMSSLGFQTLYGKLNAYPSIVCERFFAPDRDLGGRPARSGRRSGEGFGCEKKERGLPGRPLAIESQRELSEFAVAAFSLSFELDYYNVVDILRRSGIPLNANERDERYPLVLAGGPAVTANPEPLAPFVDAFVLGEAEPVLADLARTLVESAAGDRPSQLRALTLLPGVYVPSFMGLAPSVHGKERLRTGQTMARGMPGQSVEAESAPETLVPVDHLCAAELDAFATTSVVLTRETELSDMYLIEVARGCGRGCRFCLAGYLYRPMRSRSVENLIDQAREGLRGRKRLGLVGAAVSDHPEIDRLVNELRGLGAQLSFSSLRLDRLSDPILSALLESGTRTITLAPEVGSERLMRLISKGLHRDQVLEAADRVAAKGINRLKLYFMIGLPSENDEDILAIADLAIKVKNRADRHTGHSQISLNVNPFVPKPGTPFAAEPMAETRVLDARMRLLADLLRCKGVTVKSESPAWAIVQYILSRGDRRLAAVLAAMENNSISAWWRAMRNAGMN